MKGTVFFLKKSGNIHSSIYREFTDPSNTEVDKFHSSVSYSGWCMEPVKMAKAVSSACTKDAQNGRGLRLIEESRGGTGLHCTLGSGRRGTRQA